MPDWDFIKSLHNAYCICKDRVSIFNFQYFKLSFHHPLFSGTCPFFMIISSCAFIQPINHAFCLDVSCEFHQIKPPYCAWGTNTNIVHLWYLIIWFIDSTGFNIVKYLKQYLVGVTSFSIGEGLGSFTFSYLNCCKDIHSFSITWTDYLLVHEN